MGHGGDLSIRADKQFCCARHPIPFRSTNMRGDGSARGSADRIAG